MSATTTNSHDDEDGNDDDDDDADQVGRHPTSEATDTDHGSYPSLLRVLCLHDVNSNALELSHRLDAMGDRLFRNHGIDLVFVNSPLLGRQQQQERHGSPEAEQPPPATFDWSKRHAAHPRVWWETADVEGRTGNPLLSDGDDQCVDDGVNSQGIESRETDIRDSEMNDTKHYVGLDASLLLLRQIWTSTPFWGILAFGQGASVASFFPLMAVPPTPGFCIFVEGTTILDEDELLVVDDIPCLHIVGRNPSHSTLRLVKQFGGEVSSESPSFSTRTINRIGKFMVAQKKKLRKNELDINVLALQNQLYWAEQQAAQLVAHQIAKAPPKALMAVISPKNVGGFQGARRRGPDEEGGGAPCPSDFLLHREKRTTNPNGPTRRHPMSHPSKEQEDCGT